MGVQPVHGGKRSKVMLKYTFASNIYFPPPLSCAVPGHRQGQELLTPALMGLFPCGDVALRVGGAAGGCDGDC